jgi:HlyD family secretion protein
MHIVLRALLPVGCCLLASCNRPDPGFVQGYVEGEFVYVAAPFAGQLKTLSVERGATIAEGAPLFVLDDTTQRAARDEAARRVAQARAQLADAKVGLRPSELDSLRAQLAKARASLAFAETELARQKDLLGKNVISQQQYDLVLSQREQDRALVDQLAADLKTGRLGARAQQVAAAEENLKAEEAALAAAEWNLARMSQAAPAAALVSDVLHRPGDWVGAERPVVELLPPGNVKVRAFVAQGVLDRIHVGDTARIVVDGAPADREARVAFISPRAEYTPPVIYSQQMREKFVWLVELSVDAATAARLHPGQPVDVRFSLAAP